MTKKEMYAEILKVVADNEELVAFVNHEIDLLNRKSSGTRKPTKTQLENEGFKADILEALAGVDEPVTIKGLCGICDSISGLTNQRVSALLTQMVKGGTAHKEVVKGRAMFTIA